MGMAVLASLAIPVRAKLETVIQSSGALLKDFGAGRRATEPLPSQGWRRTMRALWVPDQRDLSGAIAAPAIYLFFHERDLFAGSTHVLVHADVDLEADRKGQEGSGGSGDIEIDR
jgi:hypothetical protein